jgi:hypothetical protein
MLYIIKTLMPSRRDKVTVVGRMRLDPSVHPNAPCEVRQPIQVDNRERSAQRTLDTVNRHSDARNDPFTDIKVSKPINLLFSL